MTTALITHPDCRDHRPPDGHPERPERLEAVLQALADLDLQRVAAPLAAEDDLLRVHPPAHLAALRQAAPEQGLRALDPDTWMSPGSLAAAHRAAGAVVRGVDLVLSGRAANAFCAVRPPGHHAEAETAMGFCLLGSVAVGAMAALDHHGLARVAVVDFDVHHGNGTQALVEDDPRVLFISTHQSPLYPGTGAAADDGPHGTVLNLPLRAGTDGAAYSRVLDGAVIPALRDFRPELILISAGFDAHRDDPLAGLSLTAADFGTITDRLCGAARDLCQGRVVSSLEGGYDLPALAASARAHVMALQRAARGSG
jgi:acetoin utilization deacetylase AcuC-like enzyme